LSTQHIPILLETLKPLKRKKLFTKSCRQQIRQLRDQGRTTVKIWCGRECATKLQTYWTKPYYKRTWIELITARITAWLL